MFVCSNNFSASVSDKQKHSNNKMFDCKHNNKVPSHNLLKSWLTMGRYPELGNYLQGLFSQEQLKNLILYKKDLYYTYTPSIIIILIFTICVTNSGYMLIYVHYCTHEYTQSDSHITKNDFILTKIEVLSMKQCMPCDQPSSVIWQNRNAPRWAWWEIQRHVLQVLRGRGHSSGMEQRANIKFF